MLLATITKRILPLALLVLMASSGLVTAMTQYAQALAPCSIGMYDGTTFDTVTYFEQKCADNTKDYPHRAGCVDQSYGFVVPRPADCSDALSGVNSKDDFYNKLQWIYNVRGWQQQDWWAKDGVAFVVFTLIGRTNPPSDRNLTQGDWDELKLRLSNPNLTIRLDNNYVVSANNSSSIYPSGGANSNPDFAYVHYDHRETGTAYVFEDSGRFVGAIERKCANLLGEFPLPQQQSWTTAGQSLVGVGSSTTPWPPNVHQWDAAPGDIITWNHRLWNNSNYDMPSNIYWSVRQSGFTSPASQWRNTDQNPQGWSRGGPGSVNNPFVNVGPSPYDTQYVVRPEEVGQNLCQWLTWTPTAWNTVIDTPGGTAVSDKACVYIPYNFTLTPSVAPVTPAAESGVTIGPITPTVNNSGPTWSYQGTKWQLSQFTVAPGVAAPSGTDANGIQRDPCAYYGNGCKSLSSGNQQFQNGDTTVGQVPTLTVDDLPLGSQVCFALSVTGFNKTHSNQNDGWWRHSQPQCVKIGRKPKVQIWGDDAAVRGSITTSTTTKNGTVFGSWVEYGALSVGSNSQFASGAGLVSQTSSDQASWSKLTFANIAPNYGRYAAPSAFRPLPSIASYFRSLQSTQTYDPSVSLDSNSFKTGDPIVVRKAGDLDLSAQPQQLSTGHSVVIVASGTVNIKGDITYKGDGLKDLRDIPQLVIIAKNINIEQAASNVDAWLVADDTVNTCSDGPLTTGGNLSGTICNNILTVHGPVVSGKLVLNRTGGSGVGPDESGKAAEVFDLRPDAYLWAQLVASGSGRAQTVDTTELPPRF